MTSWTSLRHCPSTRSPYPTARNCERVCEIPGSKWILPIPNFRSIFLLVDIHSLLWMRVPWFFFSLLVKSSSRIETARQILRKHPVCRTMRPYSGRIVQCMRGNMRTHLLTVHLLRLQPEKWVTRCGEARTSRRPNTLASLLLPTLAYTYPTAYSLQPTGPSQLLYCIAQS